VCPTRACQDHCAVKASDSVPETPLSKGCQTWRWIGAIKLIVSLLLSAFRLLYVAMRTKEQPMMHHALRPREVRWQKFGTHEIRVDSRKVRFFIQAIVSLSRMVRCVSGLSVSTPSILVISMLKKTSASRRFV
jgi:hypothetical protein